MTASATDFQTPATVIAAHGYRGGPFVIDASNAAKAGPIITAWQAANTTTVHVASATFSAPVSRQLTVAPRIAVFNDGSQNIAFGYLNAAGIPDEKGLAWGNSSVDLLSDTAVAGTLGNPQDGVLFNGVGGQPQYCEIMTMHWNVTSTDIPGVVAEMASFLQYPVHVNAECQAVNAIEGEPPDGGRSDFVTTKGFQWPAPHQPSAVQFSNSALPFAQMDGPFQTVGGSEPAYALYPGSTYYNQDIVMIRGAGVGFGVQDIWMTGYANGVCDISEEGCNGIGKVSYLGGHQYSTNTPISKNPQTQGARLFLNSLYEAGCVTAEGQPAITLTKSGPTATATANVTYLIAYNNAGYGAALGMVLTDAIPTGSTFVSATGGGTFSGGTVTWNLGDYPKQSSGSVSVTVTLPAKGTYTNQANASFTVGLNTLTAKSNVATTVWGDCGSNNDCSPPNVCDTTTSTCGPAVVDAGADGATDGGSSGDASDDATTGGGNGDASADATTAGDDGGDATTGDDGGDATVSDATTSGSSSSGAGTSSTSGGSSSGASSASGTGSTSGSTSGASSTSGSSSGSAASGSSSGSASGSTSGSPSGSGVSSGATSGGATSSGSASDDASSDNAGGGVTGENSGCSCTQAGAPTGGTTGLAGVLGALAVAVSRRRRERRH
jgi:uncharacterized repeat protein (TIGR01451 family)/MYXO-CTERM domain-containing protein